jgi:hypothetical protein
MYFKIKKKNKKKKGEGSDNTFHLTLVKFVNQRLEELENKFKMNDSKKNEELKYKFNKL